LELFGLLNQSIFDVSFDMLQIGLLTDNDKKEQKEEKPWMK